MRIIRVLSLIGFGISAYLLAMKFTGRITSVVGCGSEGGCESVLGSKWSQWFLVPVSALSALFYLGVLAVTLKVSRPLLLMAAVLLMSVAVWFMGLQAVVIKSFCPWCFATHLVGILTALAILRKVGADFRASYLVVPLALMAGLVLGQIYGPEPQTYDVTAEGGIAEARGRELLNAGEGRLITFFAPTGEVAKSYRLGAVPLIGSPNAKHVMVKYFDYTCKSCRQMERGIAALIEQYPEEIAVIVLPVPLNSACNPYLGSGIADHAHACELARLGLAVWRSQPESFDEAHEILFAQNGLTGEIAKENLGSIISSEKLAVALEDPWIEEILKSNFEDYRLLSSRSIVMPKLVVAGTKTMHGMSKSKEAFVKLIAQEFQLQ